MIAVGVDAYRRSNEAGWVAIALRDGRFADATRSVSLAPLLDRFADASAIGVDMPIGLPRGRRPRACDLAARELLGPRRSTVFLAAPAAVLRRPDHASASALARERTGAGVSQQAYGLRAKILELAPLAARDRRLVEVHPEVSFAAMAGAPVLAPKTSWAGAASRRRLLAERGIEPPEDLGEAGVVSPIDVLDAAAAAWSAARVARGEAESLPAHAAEGAAVIWR